MRNLVFDGIVSIEVFLKGYTGAELDKATGPFGYLEPAGLPGRSTEEHKSAITSIAKNYKRSSLPQLKHFKSTYCDSLQPIWMLVDCLSYGDFKKVFYKGPTLLSNASWPYNWVSRPTSLVPATRNCYVVGLRIFVARNKTAYHDRFWNCIDPKMTPHQTQAVSRRCRLVGNEWELFRRPESRGPAGFLTMEHFLLKQLGVIHRRKNLIDLMNRYPGIPLKPMGFPDDWQKLPIWQ